MRASWPGKIIYFLRLPPTNKSMRSVGCSSCCLFFGASYCGSTPCGCTPIVLGCLHCQPPVLLLFPAAMGKCLARFLIDCAVA